jgi:aminobenzoyl-glutamate utilization protein B
MRVLDENWARILEAAQGAARGTGTRVDHEVIHAVYSVLPNRTLSKLIDANLREVGGFAYTPEEIAFAEALQKSMANPRPIGSQETVEPWEPEGAGEASTDVGDVSWVVPTAQLRAATWVPGTPGHSWQAVASGGTSIGAKGMMVAAKALALTACDLYRNPARLQEARAEWQEARGADFKYRALVGDRKPPLDYRK